MGSITGVISLTSRQQRNSGGKQVANDANRVGESQDVRKLVRAHMLRVDDGKHGRPCNRPSPILILEGPPGSGKTAVLDSITRDLMLTVPFARFDFTTDPAPPTDPDKPKKTFWQEIDDALTAIVWELSQWRPIYGSLRFPRFAIAQLVRRLDLDPNQPIKVLQQEVITALERHRRVDRLRQVLQDAATQALGRAPGPLGWSLKTLGRYVVQLAFDWLVSRTTGRRVLLGRCQHWYGTRGQGNDLDVLVNLNRWTRKNANPTFRAQATQLMFAAFFADLRDDFQRGRRSGEWSFNSVLFLENVASEWGSAFLAELGTARAQHRRQETDDADPLTVVATSRTRVTGTQVVRILLRPLDLPTVSAMVNARSWAGGDPRRLAARIHAFTGGHPEAVDLLLEAAVGHGVADVELNDLLARRADGTARGLPPDRAEVLLQRLLPAVLDDEIEDLVTLSAARDRDQVVRLARRTKLLLSDLRNPSALGPDLWVADNAGGPLLRRLLLRRLAAREPDHPADWLTVHGALRRFCRDATPRDTVGELYHALAVGDLQFVMTELAERTGNTATNKWLELLKSVTTAPRRRDDRPPDEQVDEFVRMMTAPSEKAAALAGVVAGLWVANDPATPGNRNRLHKLIAKKYDGMADLAKNPAVIEDEADTHREVAEQWR